MAKRVGHKRHKLSQITEAKMKGKRKKLIEVVI